MDSRIDYPHRRLLHPCIKNIRIPTHLNELRPAIQIHHPTGQVIDMWMPFNQSFIRCVVVVGFVAVSATIKADDAFTKDIAPLLERKCLTCHNTNDHKGDFALETREQLLASGFVIARNPDDSHLISVLVPESPDAPPSMPKDSAPLTTDEVDTIRQWIADGAVWPDGLILKEPVIDDFDWWSFRPVVEHTPPALIDDASRQWVRTPIDAFVLSALQQRSLVPSPEADRRTLIRRVTFDLIGLPPTPEDVVTFVNNKSPKAYESLVDHLLNSPQYGERWARHWLDVVRYADTCGYDKDKLRPNSWPYRDYVIRSFNDDKPYGRFVQEQLAGDILFPGEPDGILGLGFIATGPWDFIGHVEVSESKIDGKVARNLDRDDMVTGTLNTFCSVTIQCARCHNHKFDPYTQQHYYSLQSVFAAVDRAERPYDADPKIEARRGELTQLRDSSKTELEKIAATIRTEAGEPLAALEKQLVELRPKVELAPKRPEYGYHSDIAASPDTEKWVEVDLGRNVEIASVVLSPCHDEFGGIGAGFGFPVRFRIEAIANANRPADSEKSALSQMLRDETAADFANPGLVPVFANTSVTARYVRVTATHLATRQNDYMFALAELQVLDSNGKNLAASAAVNALDSIEAPDRWRKSNLTDGIWPSAVDSSAAAQLANITRQRDAIVQRLDTPDRIQQRKTLTAQLASADKELGTLPQGRMIYAAATNFPPQGNFKPTSGVPRNVTVLHRGNETQPGEPVTSGTIPLTSKDIWQFNLPANHSEADRRAALAKWVTQQNHPLTWRSIVNRVWQYHFGRAIVDSPNDFGRMGQRPSHPELLDWLAADFLKHGQSFKHLHRLIVTSATYRQSAQSNPAAEAIDGENTFLWRMNRRRLEAEEIRDSILAVSGKLNMEMGGPGFYLFELEKPEHSPHYEYNKFDPEDARSHRRSIYRFIVRSQPDPFMTTLDCADSSQSTPRRHETLTALQALSLLNNRFNISMARHFSDRLKQDNAAVDSQITGAFLLLTGRQPVDEELRTMSDYANKHGLPALCRLLFNLSEFVFVD